MTPHEFIKEHGLNKAKEILGAASETDIFYNLEQECYIGLTAISYGPRVSLKELSTLVYHFKSVWELGGVEAAKKYMDSPYTAPEIKTFLAQALAEMEKCQ